MSETQVQLEHSTGHLIKWMIISQLLAVITLIIWGGYILPSLIFAGDMGMGVVLILLIFFYPIFPLIMVVGSWTAYAFRASRLAAIFSGLSLAPALLYLISQML
jgi:O-antigen/teichoic acid export membrane protein